MCCYLYCPPLVYIKKGTPSLDCDYSNQNKTSVQLYKTTSNPPTLNIQSTMKFTLTSLALPLLAAAAPVTQSTANPPFSVMSIRSGSPIHYLQLNAAGQKFYLGGSTATYCPTQVTDCPPGNQTVLAPGGTALVSHELHYLMPTNVQRKTPSNNEQDTMVPGGQQVYIDPNGALSFTQAHSANIPQGSLLGPFHYSADEPWAHYSFGSTGFMACPAEDNRWQVFAAIQNATVPNGNVDECLGFSAVALDYTGDVPAWQYI